jgi:hypothetical protein
MGAFNDFGKVQARRAGERLYWGGLDVLRKYVTQKAWGIGATAIGSSQAGFDNVGSVLSQAPPSNFAIPCPFKWRLYDARTLDADISWRAASNTAQKYLEDEDVYFIPGNSFLAWIPDGQADAYPIFSDPGGILDTTPRLYNGNIYFPDPTIVYKPDNDPVMGYVILAKRHMVSYTADTATPYTLTVTDSIEGTVFSETIDPLSEDLFVAFVERTGPIDAAVFTANINQNSDGAHPHKVYAALLSRRGLYVKKMALPEGYTAVAPSFLTGMLPGAAYPGNVGKSGASLRYGDIGQTVIPRHANILGGSVSSIGIDTRTMGPFSPALVSGEYVPIIAYAAYGPQNRDLINYGPLCAETDTVDFVAWGIGGGGGTVTIFRWKDWVRNQSKGDVPIVLATVSIPSGYPISGPGYKGTAVLSETPPKGGGFIEYELDNVDRAYYSCRRSYETPPPVCVPIFGESDIIPGGFHSDQIVTTVPSRRGVQHVTGADGGEVETEVTFPAVDDDYYGNNAIPSMTDIQWNNCDAGVFYANRGGAVTGNDGSSVFQDSIAYTRNGVRRIIYFAALTTSAYPLGFSAVKLAVSGITTLVLGANDILNTTVTIPPSTTRSIPNVAQFTAPDSASYDLVFNWRGSSDSNLPGMSAYQSIIQISTGLIDCGYRDDTGCELFPVDKSLNDQILATSLVQDSANSFQFASVIPTTAKTYGIVGYLIDKAADWTGTPWQGKGGQVAFAELPRRANAQPFPLPTDVRWMFASPNDGTFVSIDSNEAYIKDASEASGWKAVSKVLGVDSRPFRVTLLAGDSITCRIASIDIPKLSGMAASSWAGAAFGASARWRVTVTQVT